MVPNNNTDTMVPSTADTPIANNTTWYTDYQSLYTLPNSSNQHEFS
jgi:hypothetical protein